MKDIKSLDSKKENSAFILRELLLEKAQIDLKDYFEFKISQPILSLDSAPSQVYVGGVRLQSKTFKNKTSACVWHDKQKEQLLKDPSATYQEKPVMLFSDCLKRYKEEAIPLLQKSSQQSYEFHFRYFTKGPLSTIKMEYLNSKAIYVWLGWLKKHPTAKNAGRKSFIHELKLLSNVLNWYRNFLNEDFNVPITKQHRRICYYKRVPLKRPDYYARPDELRAWIKWLKENRKNVYYQLATFMPLTGARVGEASGMLWSAIILRHSYATMALIATKNLSSVKLVWVIAQAV